MTKGQNRDDEDVQNGSFDGVDLVGREFLGRYRLLEQVGEGGMSVVFKALHMKMDRVVAVKVLSRQLMKDDDQVRAFNKEAFACSRLSHPNTIRVFDFGESSDGYLFLVMEYLEGETLGDLLRREGRVDLMRAMHITRQIMKSLAEAHSVGIIHRDMKPDNIFITNVYGELDYVKVLDFGIAKVLERGVNDDGTQPGGGKIWGSPLYLSPEQFMDREMGPASDIYSVGCILYEMLVGVPPFVGKKAIDVVMAHIEQEPTSLREMAPTLGFTENLEAAVMTLLNKAPEERPKTADHTISLLDDALVADGHAVFSESSPDTDPERISTGAQTGSQVLHRRPSQAIDIGGGPKDAHAPAPKKHRGALFFGLLLLVGVAFFGIRTLDNRKASQQDPPANTVNNGQPQPNKTSPVTEPVFARPEAVQGCAKCLFDCRGREADGKDLCNTACKKRFIKNNKERQQCEGALQALVDSQAKYETELARLKEAAKVEANTKNIAAGHQTLLITSVPPGAEIIVDNLLLGHAPVTFRHDHEGGSHELLVKKNGYAPRNIILTADLVKALPKEGLKVELSRKRRPPKRTPNKNKKKSKWKQW